MSFLRRFTPVESDQEYADSIEILLRWRAKVDSLAHDIQGTLNHYKRSKTEIEFSGNQCIDDLPLAINEALTKIPLPIELGFLLFRPKLGYSKRSLVLSRIQVLYDRLQSIRRKIEGLNL